MKKGFEVITIAVHPTILKKLKKIKDERKAIGDPCTISELVRKSIIKFLEDKK